MLTAARFHIKPAEFWELTPYELGVWVRGQQDAERERFAEIIAGAWNNANFGRVSPKKPLPNLGRLVRAILKQPRREQSGAEALRIAERLNKLYGGTDRRHLTNRKAN